MWMTFKNFVVSIVVIQTTFICTSFGQTLYDGSACVFKGNRGICRVVTACPSILAELTARRLSYAEMVQCGFQGLSPIICCPDNVMDRVDTSTSTTTEEIFTFDSGNTRATTLPTRPTTAPTRPTPRPPVTNGIGSRARSACTRYSANVAAPLDFQILGGVPAAPGEFPHMAAFGYNDISGIAWNCGGSLISERYVLTAAHCVARQSNMPTVIRLGKTTLDSNEDQADSVDISIAEVIRHPDYLASQNYHDIALVRLSRDAPINNFVRPACLYTDQRDNALSETLIATGWGTVNPDTREKSNILLKVNLTIVELNSCNETHVSLGLDRRLRNGLDRGQMCAFFSGKDTCEGDSGGPLQIQDEFKVSTIVGITSFGLSCGANVPSVYARVAFYLDWIENTVWPS